MADQGMNRAEVVEHRLEGMQEMRQGGFGAAGHAVTGRIVGNDRQATRQQRFDETPQLGTAPSPAMYQDHRRIAGTSPAPANQGPGHQGNPQQAGLFHQAQLGIRKSMRRRRQQLPRTVLDGALRGGPPEHAVLDAQPGQAGRELYRTNDRAIS